MTTATARSQWKHRGESLKIQVQTAEAQATRTSRGCSSKSPAEFYVSRPVSTHPCCSVFERNFTGYVLHFQPPAFTRTGMSPQPTRQRENCRHSSWSRRVDQRPVDALILCASVAEPRAGIQADSVVGSSAHVHQIDALFCLVISLCLGSFFWSRRRVAYGAGVSPPTRCGHLP